MALSFDSGSPSRLAGGGLVDDTATAVSAMPASWPRVLQIPNPALPTPAASTPALDAPTVPGSESGVSPIHADGGGRSSRSRLARFERRVVRRGRGREFHPGRVRRNENGTEYRNPPSDDGVARA